MTHEHHAPYWCMKPSVNRDVAVIAKVTKRVRIAILGNVIAINDLIRMAEEIAMLDCDSGGRVISGFVRGTEMEKRAKGYRAPSLPTTSSSDEDLTLMSAGHRMPLAHGQPADA
jgi:alkanesulfonate monooxygenase SsuD/methylene tetrahydromethanopterin reductase-like flavin-dependent oxidoreductase (luciferase family)